MRTLVEEHQTIVLIPQGKAVGDALDRIGETRPRLLDQGLRPPPLGDIGVHRDKAAAWDGIAANLQTGAVRAHSFAEIGFVDGRHAL